MITKHSKYINTEFIVILIMAWSRLTQHMANISPLNANLGNSLDKNVVRMQREGREQGSNYPWSSYCHQSSSAFPHVLLAGLGPGDLINQSRFTHITRPGLIDQTEHGPRQFLTFEKIIKKLTDSDWDLSRKE